MSRRVAILLLVVGTALVALYLSRGRFSLTQLVEQERQLRDLIQARPWSSFGIAFVAYVLISIFPGSGGKSVVVGWFFGFWRAWVMVVGALTIAAVIAFTIARYLLRAPLRDRFHGSLMRFDRAVERDGAYYLLTVRLFHVPYSLVNYISGVSAVSLPTFAWTTGVGISPGTVVMVGVGAGLPSLGDLLERGVISLLNPMLLAALAATGLVPLTVRWLVRRFGRPDDVGGALDEEATARERSV